jgi:hypothetical protein
MMVMIESKMANRYSPEMKLSVFVKTGAIHAPTTFYRWYERFVEQGPEGLEVRPSSPSRVWNRTSEAVRDQIVTLALDESEQSPRELAVEFTDTKKYFASAASVYRLLKSHDLNQPGLDRDQGYRCVQRQDLRAQPDVAD